MSAVDRAPIILFAFNRPKHTRQTIDALAQNIGAAESDLHIFVDGPRAHRAEDAEMVRQTVEVVSNVSGFRSVQVKAREQNAGLANSVIQGVTAVMEQYGRAIVVEDDILTSPHFLNYMNEGLEFYQDQPKVMSLSAYNPPPEKMPIPATYTDDVYFNLRNWPWGWASWKDRWSTIDWQVSDYEQFMADRKAQKEFNRGGQDMTELLREQMEGRINSWAIRFSYAHFRQQKLSVCPRTSYVDNIGFDGTGTHFGVNTKMGTIDLSQANRHPRFLSEVKVDPEMERAYYEYQRRSWKWHTRIWLRHHGFPIDAVFRALGKR